jgi:hypothetical protein
MAGVRGGHLDQLDQLDQLIWMESSMVSTASEPPSSMPGGLGWRLGAAEAAAPCARGWTLGSARPL